MMTLDEARAAVGAEVVHHATGVIADVSEQFVWVLYDGNDVARSVHPDELTLGGDETAAQRQAALDLHAPRRLYPEARFAPWCGECSTGITTFHDDGAFTHRVSWPCPTAQALGASDPLAVDEPVGGAG